MRPNDIASFDFLGFNPASYEQQMIDEFDQLSALDQLCRAEGCGYGAWLPVRAKTSTAVSVNLITCASPCPTA